MFTWCPPENNFRINSAVNLTVLAIETKFSTTKGNEALLMLVQEKAAFHV